MNVRVSFVLTILLTFAELLICCPLPAQSEALADDVTHEALRFTRIYDALEQNYMEPLDPDRAIFDGGIRGMLSTLDPFSVFLDREQFELLQQQARGRVKGFGSVLYVQPGKVLVLQTAQGSPSRRAGLGPGDEILEVNGTRIDRLDLRSLIELLQRSRSQTVRLGVIRPGKVVAQDFELNPAEVSLPTVDRAFLFETSVAYVHLTSFEQETTQELVDALERLGSSNLKGLLLDLRDNHGGMLESALSVVSLFLKPDLLVLTVRGRATPEKSFRAVSGRARFDMPLIVLVSENTASAAEIVAAALQEHDRALIVGEPTFGKGVVETVMPLSEGTGLALTSAQYFTPSGRSVQRPLPDTALAVTDPSLNTASAKSRVFRTATGRHLAAGGGVTPDVLIPPRRLDPWVTFLNQRGVFTNFASEYLTRYGKVDLAFDADEKILGNFRDFLGRQAIRVPEEYWVQDQPYLRLRIKTEISNLVFGLAQGDEVEVRGDPQVQEAARLFPKLSELLRPPPASAATIPARDNSRQRKALAGVSARSWRLVRSVRRGSALRDGDRSLRFQTHGWTQKTHFPRLPLWQHE